MESTTKKINNKPKKKQELIQKLKLFDDIFFHACMKDCPEAVEYILRIIMKMPDLTVEEVRTQEMEVSIDGRSVILDVLATDQKGRKFNVEVQRASPGASPRRTRYIRSQIDANSLQKGQSFQDLPDLYIIFITEKDYFQKNRPLYHFKMMNTEDHSVLQDGSEVIYVNGSWNRDDEIGSLMNDFRETDPLKIKSDILRGRVKYFKTPRKEGERLMCELIEEYAKEFYWPEVLAEKHRADLAEKKAIDFEERMLLAEQKSEKSEETARQSAEIIEDCALSFLQSGFSLEETAAKTRLSMEKVQEIAAKVSDQI